MVETTATAQSAAHAAEQTQQQQQDKRVYADMSLFNKEYVEFLNQKLTKLEPQKIIEWAILSLPNLWQSTAFGLTGLVIRDMLWRLSASADVPLIFVDTLYHFQETLDLAQTVATRYETDLHTYTPLSCPDRDAFERQHGLNLWTSDPDVYDYLVKVEPARRAYAELNVQAYFTGRRRSQKGLRSSIPIIELDTATSPPILKINALANWSYDDVWAYVQQNAVPYNPLVDKGYKSIGDFHSTAPTQQGEDERAGRWKGQEKSECGLHKDYLKMRASYLAAKKKKLAVKASGIAAIEVDAGVPSI
ncbi:hypothetical protein BC832DRAFT_560151 [Gaertneriomyces semiglobifer]|nr:hypothetical protein BC832DRAFT_560151 [Gaertneriomyces semiglobifer]